MANFTGAAAFGGGVHSCLTVCEYLLYCIFFLCAVCVFNINIIYNIDLFAHKTARPHEDFSIIYNIYIDTRFRNTMFF